MFILFIVTLQHWLQLTGSPQPTPSGRALTTKQEPTTDPRWEGTDLPTGSPQLTPSARVLTTNWEPTTDRQWEGTDHQAGAHNRPLVGGCLPQNMSPQPTQGVSVCQKAIKGAVSFHQKAIIGAASLTCFSAKRHCLSAKRHCLLAKRHCLSVKRHYIHYIPYYIHYIHYLDRDTRLGLGMTSARFM